MRAPDLIAMIEAIPGYEDLDIYLTNGDLPPVPVISALPVAADYGLMILISR